MAEVRARFTNPDTIPYFPGGSELIIALVLGELKVAIPSPDRNMPSTTCHAEESVPSRERVNIPAVEKTIPVAAGQRVPTRSDSLPISGATIARQSEPGIIRSAARLASYPSPCMR